jgi:hypothetical protein
MKSDADRLYGFGLLRSIAIVRLMPFHSSVVGGLSTSWIWLSLDGL